MQQSMSTCVDENFSTNEVPEIDIVDPLVINKRGRSYLKNVPIDADNPALLVGWYDERVAAIVDIINNSTHTLPPPPEFLPLGDKLTPLLFKDSIHMKLSEQGDGYFSNIIAPCTLDQVMEMVFVLSEIQRHPFIQAVVRQARLGPLAVCGTCLDNKSCTVIPLNLFMPPPPTLQVFA